MWNTNCIFCGIVAKEAPAEMAYEDEEVIVFKDIKPVATFHFLCIPKKHIVNVNSLTTASDKDLVLKLIECGKSVLSEKGADLENILIGFHLPPFNTVNHLHLHLISSTADMSFWSRLAFKPNTWWFATADQVIKKIEENDAS